MNITGLDYNTQREQLLMPEYGREIQRMVQYAQSLPSKQTRLQCAKAIVRTMEIMQPQVRQTANYKQKLWDQLAVMCNFELDIDWPVDVSHAKTIQQRPAPLSYPMQRIPVRHYGVMVMEMLERIKEMPKGSARDRLIALTANQMRRDILQWGHGATDAQRVASDMARLTDGAVQLDVDNFRFTKMDVINDNVRPQRRKRR